MRVLLTILAAGAALGLVLFALGVFDAVPATLPANAPVGTAPPPATDDGGATALGGNRAPTNEPELLLRKFEAPVGVLLLSPRPTTWSAFVAQSMNDSQPLRYATWFTDSHDVRDVSAGPGPGPQRGIELKDLPTAGDLGRLEIEVLIVDSIDPNILPGTFWDEVSKRVASGDLGLWVRPGFPVGPAGEAQTAHPMLSHPSLAALLPVAEAAPLAGSPVPGTFQDGVAMVLSDHGARHPATRLTPYPKWAYHIWEKQRSGEFAWKPKFCYPVTKLAPGAVSLVDVLATSIDRKVAIAVSSQDVGRVLWQGNFDFGHRTYYSAESTKPVGILVNRMLLWLSGRAAP